MGDLNLERQAIDAALNQEWENAVRFNSQLLQKQPENVKIMIRLAFAQIKLGKYIEAKLLLDEVIKQDKYNQIANKHLQALSILKSKKQSNVAQKNTSYHTFIEEPGKSKTVRCVNIAKAEILSQQSPGTEVSLIVKKRCVELRDAENQYLGVLPDDISFKLMKFIEGGNTYCAAIKYVDEKTLDVVVKELHRSNTFRNQATFSSPSMTNILTKKKSNYNEPPDTSSLDDSKD